MESFGCRLTFVTLDASTLTFTASRGLSDLQELSSDEVVHLDESDHEFVFDNDDVFLVRKRYDYFKTTIPA